MGQINVFWKSDILITHNGQTLFDATDIIFKNLSNVELLMVPQLNDLKQIDRVHEEYI